MPLAILAFVFGALLFLMSAAALVLEAGLWRLPLLMLAMLHAASGFVAVGGMPALAHGRWRTAAGCAAAGCATTIVATLAAFHLAAACRFSLSQGAAVFIVVSTLAAGIISAAMVVHYACNHATEA